MITIQFLKFLEKSTLLKFTHIYKRIKIKTTRTLPFSPEFSEFEQQIFFFYFVG